LGRGGVRRKEGGSWGVTSRNVHKTISENLLAPWDAILVKSTLKLTRIEKG